MYVKNYLVLIYLSLLLFILLFSSRRHRGPSIFMQEDYDNVS